ncbi:hypothetical protein P3382_26890 [Vibrio parahaemolyticus]|nr:hypothetical protein [Vibrio parahaemolyticus]
MHLQAGCQPPENVEEEECETETFVSGSAENSHKFVVFTKVRTFNGNTQDSYFF